METVQMICCLIFLALAAGTFVISYLQFKEKGYLFNNAYFWASQEERKWMDENKASKTPHYRQSGFAFMFVGILFLMLAAYIATGWIWMSAALVLVAIIAVIYAIVSSVKIERQQKNV